MPFTSASAKRARQIRAGKCYARKYKDAGYPTLAKARAVRAANLAAILDAKKSQDPVIH